MLCPACDAPTRVIQTRSKPRPTARSQRAWRWGLAAELEIRRRRECLACGFRFTTYEVADKPAALIYEDRRRRELAEQRQRET